MTTATDHSLAFDLLEADLEAAAGIATLVARHAVNPARRVFDGHRLSFALGSGQALWSTGPTAATLERALRGLVLVRELFPGAVRATRDGAWDPAQPGRNLPPWLLLLAFMTWEELLWVAGTALGEAAPAPASHTLTGAASPRSGVRELEAAKATVAAALRAPRDMGREPIAREGTGLEALEGWMADELDAALARGAGPRLIRIIDVEPMLAEGQVDHPDAPDLSEPLIVERGVFPMTLPTTITGLVLLDLIETFRRGRTTGMCELCGRPFLLESQQVSLVRRGQPVYHPACFRERRRRYMRDYRAARRADVNSRSRLSVSTDGS